MPALHPELSFASPLPPTAEQAQQAHAHAREALRQARAERQRQEEIEKSARRSMRGADYKRRQEGLVAHCGINFYFRRKIDKSWWTHCRTCGAELRYFEDPGEALAKAGPCVSRHATDPLPH